MAQYIGQYEVIRELGAGRFGSVYLAVGDVPGKGPERPVRRIVAIKRLRDVADRERMLAALRSRLALLDQAREPRFVEVYELLDDGPSIVMEYVHGVTLDKALADLKRSREQVFTEAAVEIGCELAEALYKINSTPGKNGEPLGLVHQRLKPAHIVLTADARVRIMDFGTGTATLGAGGPTAVGEDVIYLAPEQARREEVDGRTDLFAVGLILFELLMTEPAYRPGGTELELLRQVTAGDLKEACRSLEQTLPALGPILRRALQARPEDRYRSGNDLLVDLRRQLYRERGAYLKEFCEFFFSTIHPLDPPPNLDDFGGGRGGKRKSIDERLREARSGESIVPNGPAAPRVSPPNRAATLVPDDNARRAPQPRPEPAASPVSPRAAAPPVSPRAAAPPPPPEGAPMSNPAGGKKSPPRPPVGGPASRATPFDPSADGGIRRVGGPPKSAGERRPDETGMLEMVPLSNNKDQAEAAADPSATAFFAIPAPKADRAKPAPPLPPAMGGPIGVSASPSMSPGPASLGPPPVIGGPIASGPVASGPMVQGPVAGYGAGASPFQVQGPTPTAPTAEAGQRVQSNRVYAILIAVFLLVGIAVVAAVALIPREDKPVAQAPTPAQPVVVTKAEPKAEVDTGGPPPPPVATPKPKVKAAPSTPKAAPAPTAGTLSVSLADASQATSIEVVCPSGFRQRGSLSGGKGSIGGVPNESCTMFFKGGPPAQFKPVRGGSSYSCKIVGTTAVCN